MLRNIITVILGKYQVAALNFYQSIAAIEHCRSNDLDPDNSYIQKSPALTRKALVSGQGNVPEKLCPQTLF